MTTPSMPVSPGTKTLTIELSSIIPSQAPIVDEYIRLIVVLKSISRDGIVSIDKHFDWFSNRWINTDTFAEEMHISGYSLGKKIGGLTVVSITLSR